MQYDTCVIQELNERSTKEGCLMKLTLKGVQVDQEKKKNRMVLLPPYLRPCKSLLGLCGQRLQGNEGMFLVKKGDKCGKNVSDEM